VIEIEERRGDDVVTVKLSGIVTRNDVDAAIPRLEAIFEDRRQLRLYVELVGLERFELAGLWKELTFQARHRDQVTRTAFVVGSPGEEWAGWLAEQMSGGTSRRFALGEEAQAQARLREA
jgi:hypothetical protein